MNLKLVRLLIKYSILLKMLSGCQKVSYEIKKEKIYVHNKKRTYYAYLSNPDSSKKPRKFFFFLHGLLSPNQPLNQFMKLLKDLNLTALDQTMIIYPVGIPEVIQTVPGFLGWTPNYYADNLLFIKQIINKLKIGFDTKDANFIVGGFSNGAYFLSQVLQSKDADLFNIYWLQGGGNPIPICPEISKKIVYLEVGKKDFCNISSVRLLKKHLLENGWILDKNLFYNETDNGHTLELKTIPGDSEYISES